MISCSWIGSVISSRTGSPRTVPCFWSLSMESQLGMLRDSSAPSAPSMRAAFWPRARQLDLVALAHAVRRDVDAAPVHLEVTVAHELARLVAGSHEAQPEDDVVEPALEQRHQVLALHALQVRGLVDGLAELPLEDAVDAAHLLLLAQLLAVVARTSAGPDRAGPADSCAARSSTCPRSSGRPSGTASCLRGGTADRRNRCSEPRTSPRRGAAWAARQPLCGIGVTSRT